MTHWVLLGSPFLGPEVWEPVAAVLGRDDTATVLTAPADDGVAGVLAGLRAGLHGAARSGESLVLVPHSNAGLYVAALAEDAPSVAGVVFVDALLPGPGPTTPVTGAALADALSARAEDGLLPPWTRWWPDADVDGLFPSEAARERVEAGQPRVPASYLREEVPSPPGWEALPCGYVAFGPAYDAEVALARDHGWPVAELAGDHLHPLVDPAGVAAAVRSVHVPRDR